MSENTMEAIFLPIVGLVLVCMFLLPGCARAQAQQQDIWREVTLGSVPVEDGTMEYCRFGQGEKTLVILPGLGIQSVMLSAQAIAQAYEQIARTHTVYVFERRNPLPQTCSVPDTARDTARALEAIGLEHVCLMGASYGGMVAMTLAIEAPERVDKLVLAATSANVTREEYRVIENWIRLAESGDAAALVLAFGEALYPRETAEQLRESMIDAARTVTQEDLRRFIILARGIRGFDVQAQLERIACPVLAVGDLQDHVLGPEGIRNIAQRLRDRPGFECIMYDGYGHAVYDLAPDFKERICRFLSQPEQEGKN